MIGDFDNSNDYHNERIMRGVSQGLEQHRTLEKIMAKAIALGWTKVRFSRFVEVGGLRGKRGTSHLPDFADGLPEILSYEAAFHGEITMYFDKPAVGAEPTGISHQMFFTLDQSGIVSWSCSALPEEDKPNWLQQIVD
jgi:hypothetical protein